MHGNAWECLGLLALQDPTRVFYESLLDEKPDSPIAIKCACKISRDSQEILKSAKCQGQSVRLWSAGRFVLLFTKCLRDCLAGTVLSMAPSRPSFTSLP